MTRNIALVALVVTVHGTMPSAQAALIDNFSTTQFVTTNPATVGSEIVSNGVATGANSIGGNRSITVRRARNTGAMIADVNGMAPGIARFSNQTTDGADFAVLYDGGTDSTITGNGLGGVNLTTGGVDRFRVWVRATSAITVAIDVHTSGNSFSRATFMTPDSGLMVPFTIVEIPFASFAIAPTAVNPANFASVGAIRMFVPNPPGPFANPNEIQFDLIETSAPTGACCVASSPDVGCACRIVTEADCGFAGGTYYGDGRVCSGNVNDPPVIGMTDPILGCYDAIEDAVEDAEAAVRRAGVTDTCPRDLTITPSSDVNDCVADIEIEVEDNCGQSDSALFQTVIDPDAPRARCGGPEERVAVDEDCEATFTFRGRVADTCCVDVDSIMVTAMIQSGMALLEVESCTTSIPDGEDTEAPMVVDVSCTIEVERISECPVEVLLTLTASDCCGHPLAMACTDTVFVVDRIDPVITHCPEPITVERGDKICSTEVQDWLDSFMATDNCGGPFYEAEPDVAIPDYNFTGVSHTINVPESFTINDLNVDLEISHTRVGDLVVMISHGATTVTIIDRPGTPGPGCSADNYEELFLDDEGTLPIETQCANNLMSPPNYIPNNPLSAFDGMDAQGDWTITVKDVVNYQSGRLTEWSLHFNSGPVLTNDAPECGFPAGTTTEVTFTATDVCGNTAECVSRITVEPEHRVTFDQKGSLLIFSKVEIKWDAAGKLIQDTFLDLTNDYPEGVFVQAYFINGDVELEEERNEAGQIVQGFEPGWNAADCRFELTANQPHYWSAAHGSDKCQAFTVLDSQGRSDPEDSGASRVLRGYVIMWAVEFSPEKNLWEEIRWNHLKGDAVIVNYARGMAWEYNAWSTQARCGAHGQPLLDCIEFDENGVCCDAEVIPGNMDLDGFQYDVAFDTLLLDFYGTGSTALSGGNATVSVDTDLTVHAVSADLRQDGCGPVLTKIEAEIWNEFETKFSGTRRCICCWDQTMLSDWVRSEAIPNHFKRSALRTDKGKARLDGVYSVECDYKELCGERAFDKMWSCGRDEMSEPYSSFSQDAAILGLATKFITFTGGVGTEHATAGMNLVGAGREASTIQADVMYGAEELQGGPARPISGRGTTSEPRNLQGGKRNTTGR